MLPLVLRRKPFGFEAQRIGKVPGVAMHYPLAHQHRCRRGQEVWPQVKIIQRLAAHRPRRWKQAHRFRKHHIRVFQLLQFFRSRHPAAENTVNFLVQPPFGIWILR